MKLSLAKKMYLLMIPISFVGLVVGVITWRSLKIGTAELEQANQLSQQAMLSRFYVSEMGDAMKGYLLNPTNHAEADRKKVADENNGKAIEKMKSLTSDEELLKMIEASSEFDAKTMDPSENQVLDFVKAGKQEQAHEYFVSTYVPNRQQSNKLSEAVADKARSMTSQKLEEIRAQIAMALNLIVLTGLVGVLVVLSLIVFLTRTISRDLRKVADGLAETGFSVAGASDLLSEAGQKVSVGTTEAASSLEETVASVEELSSMVKLNADNAKTAAELSQQSTQSALTGEVEIQTLIHSMSQIAESSKKIEEIINVIDDIAFQTNLLALNAAVEAARAGEQGKGFAVVAEAVRGLAQRSATAAKDITLLIKESTLKTEQGVKVADKSSVVLKAIVESIQKVSRLNGEISAASTEQSNGIGQISKAMNELDRATQSNASASSEVASEASGLATQAQTLRALVLDLRSQVDGQQLSTAQSSKKKEDSSAAQVIPFGAPRTDKVEATKADDFFANVPKAKLGSVDKF